MTRIPKLKTGSMTAKQFKSELKELGYSVYASPKLLGVSLRTSQRYASGESNIPQVIAKLIRLHSWNIKLNQYFKFESIK